MITAQTGVSSSTESAGTAAPINCCSVYPRHECWRCLWWCTRAAAKASREGCVPSGPLWRMQTGLLETEGSYEQTTRPKAKKHASLRVCCLHCPWFGTILRIMTTPVISLVMQSFSPYTNAATWHLRVMHETPIHIFMLHAHPCCFGLWLSFHQYEGRAGLQQHTLCSCR